MNITTSASNVLAREAKISVVIGLLHHGWDNRDQTVIFTGANGSLGLAENLPTGINFMGRSTGAEHDGIAESAYAVLCPVL